MYNRRGYYDRAKIIVNWIANIEITFGSVRLFSKRLVRGKMGAWWWGIIILASHNFTLLENMKIWFKIQVIINSLVCYEVIKSGSDYLIM